MTAGAVEDNAMVGLSDVAFMVARQAISSLNRAYVEKRGEHAIPVSPLGDRLAYEPVSLGIPVAVEPKIQRFSTGNTCPQDWRQVKERQSLRLRPGPKPALDLGVLTCPAFPDLRAAYDPGIPILMSGRVILQRRGHVN